MDSSPLSNSSDLSKTTPNSINGPSGRGEAVLETKKRMGSFDNAIKRMISFGNAMRKTENLIHLTLVGGFVFLTMRSLDRQYEIEDLENQRASIQMENKALKKKIWTLKQGLLEEATKENNHNLISRLKPLLGEGVVQESNAESTAPKPNFVV